MSRESEWLALCKVRGGGWTYARIARRGISRVHVNNFEGLRHGRLMQAAVSLDTFGVEEQEYIWCICVWVRVRVHVWEWVQCQSSHVPVLLYLNKAVNLMHNDSTKFIDGARLQSRTFVRHQTNVKNTCSSLCHTLLQPTNRWVESQTPEWK